MTFPDRFTLSIELGNDAMQSPDDVADALREIADTLDTHGGAQPIEGDSLDGRIFDLNGNAVGRWELS